MFKCICLASSPIHYQTHYYTIQETQQVSKIDKVSKAIKNDQPTTGEDQIPIVSQEKKIKTEQLDEESKAVVEVYNIKDEKVIFVYSLARW